MSQNMNENFKEEQSKEVDSLIVKKEEKEKEKDIIFDELFIEYLNQGIGEPHFLF